MITLCDNEKSCTLSTILGPETDNNRTTRVRRARQATTLTIRYWMETEVHVYALGIAASTLLAFTPFLIVMLSLCQNVLHWKAAADAIYFMLGDYFPDQMGTFIIRNLKVIVAQNRHVDLASLVLLLFTANGIFVPLEVALNRIWRCRENRSYLKNQLISLALVFLCGGLFLISITLTAINSEFISSLSNWNQMMAKVVGIAALRLAAVPVSMLLLFLIYWFLPNCKVPWRSITLPAIAVGLLLEALKYINYLTWPWFRVKLEKEYAPFEYSVAIVLYSFLAAMIVLAGAEWSARRYLAEQEAAIASDSVSR